MTLHQEIMDLKARIAAAHAERDGWRATGMQEKYLEAYSTVDALELRLEQLRQEGLRATARGDEPPAYDVDRSERDRTQLQHALPGLDAPLPMPPALAPDALQREVMAELAITFRGDAYHLGPYRYTAYQDAVNYARLMRIQGRAVD